MSISIHFTKIICDILESILGKDNNWALLWVSIIYHRFDISQDCNAAILLCYPIDFSGVLLNLLVGTEYLC